MGETVKLLLPRGRVAEPFHHYHYPTPSGYYRHPPYYNLTPPPLPYPVLSHSSSESFSDSSIQKSATPPKEDNNDDQDSLMLLDSEDDEIVPPLPPPLPILMEKRSEETRFPLQANDPNKIEPHTKKSEFEETRPVQSTQNSGQKKKKKAKDKIIYPITEVFNNTFLSTCLAESVSRPNFSLNLVSKFFSEEVRITSNVSGKGKNQLDKEIISAIKVASFRMWPLKTSENEAAAWRECIKAIDTGSRNLRRSRSATKEN